MLNQSCHWCDTNISVSQFWSKTWDSPQGYPASHSWGENVIHLYQTFGPELTSNIPSLYPSPVVKGKEDLVSIGVNAVKLEVLHQASVNDAFYLLNLNHSKFHDTISLFSISFSTLDVDFGVTMGSFFENCIPVRDTVFPLGVRPHWILSEHVAHLAESWVQTIFFHHQRIFWTQFACIPGLLVGYKMTSHSF